MHPRIKGILERLADSDWLVLRGLSHFITKLYDEWMAIRPDIRRRFGGDLLLGWVVVAIGMLALNVGARWAQTAGMLEGERALLQSISDWNPIAVVDLIPLALSGSPFFIVALILIASAIAINQRRPVYALGILASFFMVELILIIGWNTWNRTRPQFLYDGMFAGEFNSFPSGHVLQVVAVYGFFAYLWIRHTSSRLEQALAVIVFVVMIGVNSLERLALGRHWPSDVAAAIFIGLLWLAALVRAVHRATATGQNR